MYRLLIICFLCVPSIVHASNYFGGLDTLRSMHFEWFKQIPENVNASSNVKFNKKISNIILGKKSELTLSKPISLYAITLDSLIVIDQGNSQVFEINDKITPLKQLNRKNNLIYESLVGLCSNNLNNYYYTDSKLNKVFDYNIKNKTFSVLNDSIELFQPTGIAYSKIDKSLWVVETAAHRITILSEDGSVIKTIGKRGNGDAEFNYPTNITIGNDGNAYVVDAMNFRIQIFNKEGDFISTFGSAGDASGYFARPKGIALDSFGNIYVSDALFHVVQVFDNKGTFLYRFGEQGQGVGQFWMPSGLCIDKNNYIYIADSYNSRIQIFKPVNGE